LSDLPAAEVLDATGFVPPSPSNAIRLGPIPLEIRYS